MAEIKYHPNGETWRKTPYVNGKKHGMEFAWHENGTKAEEMYYLQRNTSARMTWNEEESVTKLTLPDPHPQQQTQLNIHLTACNITQE